MSEMRADKRRFSADDAQRGHKAHRRRTLGIIAAGVVSAATLALGWLQLQSVERAIGVQVPDTMVGGYDADYAQAVRDLLSAPVIERYQSVHYLWDLLFPVAFAALIILLVQRFSGGSGLRWIFYAVAVLYAATDIAENFAIEAMFASVEMTASEVSLASFLTTAKFVLFAAAILAFVLSFMLNRSTSRRRAGQ
ncbi:hypothetical protein GCM10027403_34770 [Arthrobacter tecti]